MGSQRIGRIFDAIAFLEKLDNTDEVRCRSMWNYLCSKFNRRVDSKYGPKYCLPDEVISVEFARLWNNQEPITQLGEYVANFCLVLGEEGSSHAPGERPEDKQHAKRDPLMRELRYETPIDQLGTYSPIVFLAGPTVRGHQQHLQPSWRFAAIELFREKGFEGSLIIPEFGDITESDKGREDIPLWEYEGLKTADCILFWIPRTRELIGLTTNFELGYWMRKKNRTQLVYGRPDDAYRVGYLDIIWDKDFIERDEEADRLGSPVIHKTLKETVDAALGIVDQGLVA